MLAHFIISCSGSWKVLGSTWVHFRFQRRLEAALFWESCKTFLASQTMRHSCKYCSSSSSLAHQFSLAIQGISLRWIGAARGAKENSPFFVGSTSICIVISDWPAITPSNSSFCGDVTDRPVLPRPYRRRIPKGGVTVLEGAGVLARGTRSCT